MKVMTMYATVTEQYQYTMVVPDSWTEDDVKEYYCDNGASGEFENVSDLVEWRWEHAEDHTDDLEEQIPALIARGDTINIFKESAS